MSPIARPAGAKTTSHWSTLAVLFWTLALLLVAGCVPPNIAPPPARILPPHTLVIAIDGVGYDVMEEAKARGLFPGFGSPSRVYSPFPSLSLVCFTSLLEDVTGFKNPGYDVWFYDPIRQEVRGGTEGEGFELSHAYLWLFDISRRGRWSHDLAYFFPRGSLKKDLKVMERSMRQEPRPQMVYLLATDAIAHTMGREELLRQLKRLSRSLTRMRARYLEETGHELKVVMFSDHGQDWGPQWRMDDDELRMKLEEAGYHNATALKAPGDVIVASFGNVRTGVVYAAPEDRAGVAEVISRQKGVDLTFYRTSEGAMVISQARGRARIDCGSHRYRYVPLNGDPLKYSPVLETLKTKGGIDGEGWANGPAWLEASQSHEYPDAVHRVCTGFRDIVTFPADVLFSTDPGAMFGPWNLEAGSNLAFGGIKGNHGGINRAESSAFVISTDADNASPAVKQYNHALRDVIFNGLKPPPTPPNPPFIDRSKDRQALLP